MFFVNKLRISSMQLPEHLVSEHLDVVIIFSYNIESQFTTLWLCDEVSLLLTCYPNKTWFNQIYKTRTLLCYQFLKTSKLKVVGKSVLVLPSKLVSPLRENTSANSVFTNFSTTPHYAKEYKFITKKNKPVIYNRNFFHN